MTGPARCRATSLPTVPQGGGCEADGPHRPAGERGEGVPYPAPSSEAVTRVMRGNRKADTKLEVRVRSELHRRGLRFRKQHLIVAGPLKVHADVAFPRQRLAVFLDGCFWHCCSRHGNAPNINASYWSIKLARNLDRDRQVGAALKEDGWQVVRIWEHVPVEEAADMVEAALAKRGASDGL